MTLEMAAVLGSTRYACRILVGALLATRRDGDGGGICDDVRIRSVSVAKLVHIEKMRRSKRVPGGEKVAKDATEDDGDDDVAVEGHGDQHDQILGNECHGRKRGNMSCQFLLPCIRVGAQNNVSTYSTSELYTVQERA